MGLSMKACSWINKERTQGETQFPAEMLRKEDQLLELQIRPLLLWLRVGLESGNLKPGDTMSLLLRKVEEPEVEVMEEL